MGKITVITERKKVKDEGTDKVRGKYILNRKKNRLKEKEKK